MILSKFFVVIEVRPCHYIRGGSRGRVQGVRTPPLLPEMTCGFLIQLVFCKKKVWVIGVEVEQETGAPPPKKNPGSAPVYYCFIAFYCFYWL